MQYFLTPYSENQQPFAYWENGFSNEELDLLQDLALNGRVRAMVGNGDAGKLSNEIRRSNLNWISNNQETTWLYQKLSHIVSSLNSEFFRFNLTGFGESIQLTNYDSSENGMYGWHIDYTTSITSPCRKLSIVMQLTDPSEYEGGNLELMPASKEVIRIKKQRGMIVAFPSWTLHQVTPVTQGNRQSLVTWITGPAFK